MPLTDSQAHTGGDITRYRALVARIRYMSQDRPDLMFASVRVCCAMAKPSMRGMECVKRIGRYFVGNQERSVGSACNSVATWRLTRMLAGEATEPHDGRSQLESS